MECSVLKEAGWTPTKPSSTVLTVEVKPGRQSEGRDMVKRILGSVGLLLAGALAGFFVAYLFQARAKPPLQFWHRNVLGDDFGRENDGDSLAEYLSREAALFGELEGLVRGGGSVDPALVLDRYDPSSPSNPANHPRNWNRTYELLPDEPRGGALLIHGLSDSPYSTRAVGGVLRDRGYYVLGLRVPGHGTLPGALTVTTWRDWSEAVRVAARHVHDRVGPDEPFVILGYSNGAALAVDYTLGAIQRRGDPPPTRLVFLSPALSVAPLARLARFQRRLALLPGLEQLAWQSNRPEFDPFKYSSFPVRAGEEIYELTSRLAARLERLADDGTLDAFPPVLVFQSVADATIPPSGVVDRLLSRLPPGDSELVLFDVNRSAPKGLFRDSGHDAFLHSLTENTGLPFGLTVVTNAAPDSTAVIANWRRAGRTDWTRTALDLEWPPMVYSLSHVAIPFPPDDPVYGTGETDGAPAVLNIGGVAARGERGMLALPMDLLMRLRYNPFFPYLEQRLVQVLGSTRIESKQTP
jgi:alpha-beta hydrolase superfamily lysophospholipase